jgi:hypothetical protein
MASHTREQIDYLLNCCESLRDTMNLVKKSFLLNPVTSFRKKQGRTYVKMGVGGNRESVQEKTLT